MSLDQQKLYIYIYIWYSQLNNILAVYKNLEIILKA